MNIPEYKIQKLLFLKGVFIKDCIPSDDIFERHIIDRLNITEPMIEYKSIPTIFNGLSTWLKKTNVKCWNCCLNFDNQPVFIPKIIEHFGVHTDYNISVYGCFCSFCCSSSYTDIYHPKICDNIKLKEMNKFLYKIFNNKNTFEILNAPSKYIMTHYGGTVSINGYKTMISDLEATMNKS